MPDGFSTVEDRAGASGAGEGLLAPALQRLAAEAARIDDSAQRETAVTNGVIQHRDKTVGKRPGPAELAAAEVDHEAAIRTVAAIDAELTNIDMMGWCSGDQRRPISPLFVFELALLVTGCAAMSWAASNWLFATHLFERLADGSSGRWEAVLLTFGYNAAAWVVAGYWVDRSDREVDRVLARYQRICVLVFSILMISLMVGVVAESIQLQKLIDPLPSAGTIGNTLGIPSAEPSAGWLKPMLGILSLIGVGIGGAVVEFSFAVSMHIRLRRAYRTHRGDVWMKSQQREATENLRIEASQQGVGTAKALEELRELIRQDDTAQKSDIARVLALALSYRAESKAAGQAAELSNLATRAAGSP